MKNYSAMVRIVSCKLYPKDFGFDFNFSTFHFFSWTNENENVIPKQLSQANLKFQLPYGEENLTKFPQLPSKERHLQLS